MIGMIRRGRIVLITAALIYAPTVWGGEVPWIDLMRSVDVVIDHQPHNTGGLPSDNLFTQSEFLPPTWQRVADDIILFHSTTIGQVNFWGFYHENSLPGIEERFRIRVYAPRPTDGLAGAIVYEANLLNVPRLQTGRTILVAGAPTEWLFSAELLSPLLLEANTLYWLEIVQDGNLESLFRWEFSRSGQTNGHAFINPVVDDWMPTAPISSNTAYQLISIPEPCTVLLGGFCLTLSVLIRRPKR